MIDYSKLAMVVDSAIDGKKFQPSPLKVSDAEASKDAIKDDRLAGIRAMANRDRSLDHHWSEDDIKVAYIVARFGLSGIKAVGKLCGEPGVVDEDQVAINIINCRPVAFKLPVENFRKWINGEASDDPDQLFSTNYYTEDIKNNIIAPLDECKTLEECIALVNPDNVGSEDANVEGLQQETSNKERLQEEKKEQSKNRKIELRTKLDRVRNLASTLKQQNPGKLSEPGALKAAKKQANWTDEDETDARRMGILKDSIKKPVPTRKPHISDSMNNSNNLSITEKALRVLDSINEPAKPESKLGKPAPSRKPHIADAKGKPAPTRKPHITKDQISDALNKRTKARMYDYFKVTDSFIDAKKKIKDALEDTETTNDAVNVAIEALNEVPAEQAIAAVIEVLAEAIDILETNGCADGFCDGACEDEDITNVDETSASDTIEGAEPAEVAEPDVEEEPEEEEDEKVEDSAPSDAEVDALLKALNADGANVTKEQLMKAYASFKKDAKVEDSVNVTVTNESGETVTVDADSSGNSTVGADVPVEPAMPGMEEPMGPEEPMGEEPAAIEGEEPMPSELPELEGEGEENVEA